MNIQKDDVYFRFGFARTVVVLDVSSMMARVIDVETGRVYNTTLTALRYDYDKAGIKRANRARRVLAGTCRREAIEKKKALATRGNVAARFKKGGEG